MAEPRLWWNGSGWTTTPTYWYNNTIEQNQLKYRYRVNIWASDAPAVFLTVVEDASQTQPIYNNVYVGGGKVLRTGETIGSGTRLSNEHSYELNISSYTSGFNFSGEGQAVGNAQGNITKTDKNTATKATSGYYSPIVTITYNANGGSAAPSPTQLLTGIAGNLSSTKPTRANHTFLGWSTSSSAHTATYAAGAAITISSNTTLYAVWAPCVTISAPEGITITFNGVSYTNQTATVGVTWGQSYSLQVTANTGWMVKTQSHPNGSLTINADEITITATAQRVGCFIDDGDSWELFLIYIDNGASWDLYLAYIDDGAQWNLMY